jgi:hypothetical protein
VNARLAAPARAALWALATVSLAYQVPLDIDLPTGASLLAARVFDGTYGAEGTERWTSGRATLVIPEPGPGRDVIVELDLDGWRPAGQPAPALVLRAGDVSVDAVVSRRDTLALATRTSGVWSSDLEIALESDTFRPPGGDARELGVRLRGLRLSDAGTWSPHRPPLRALCWSALSAWLLAALLSRLGAVRHILASESVLLGLLALGYGWQRAWAALVAPLLVVILGIAWSACVAWPLRAQRWWNAAHASLVALGSGRRRLGAARLALAALVGSVLLGAAESSVQVMDLDLGSGQEAALERGLGPYEGERGITFRRARRGATLDFTSLGSGQFRVTLVAAASEARPTFTVAELNDVEIVAADGLADEWRELRADVQVPSGQGRGLTLTFGAFAEAARVRVDRVRIERAGGLPALRPLAALLCVGLLGALVLAAAGASAGAAFASCGALWLGLAAALHAAPLTTLPNATVLVCIAVLGVVVWIAFATSTRALGLGLEIGPGVLAAASLGFMGWLAALTWPQYRGGHFGFHSQIAEEIWRGRFLIYYLPYPGSMLSRQAQWGNVIVPHPCLYHTLIAPLAALPQPWFHRAEKAVLALLLCALAIIAGRMATRLAGSRAGTLAAAFFCLSVPTYQLLGLGHLMTLLGVWAGALALAFVGRHAHELAQRRTFWAAVALLTLAFLSYTATLLFAGVIVALLAASYWRRERGLAVGLASVLGMAGLVAFGLYYLNWTLPFLTQSIPGWLHGAHEAAAATADVGDHADRLQRLLAQPAKLTYSYGHLALPFIALAGLLRLGPSRERRLLLLWLGVLWFFSVCADPFFNLLLKHHYFVVVPVAVGLAVWGAQPLRSWWQRALWLVLVADIAFLGVREAIAVATGGTP